MSKSTVLGLDLREADNFTENSDGSVTSVYVANLKILDAAALAVQDQFDGLDINVPATLQSTAPLETLYTVAVYADSRGDGGGSAGQDQLTIVLDWVDPSGFS